jgi:sec-independent protein translocase protein TatB
MFDISWTEFLLIAIVALVFIGPKELPAVLRTIGQYTRKIRGMAAEFQSQFQEAMREAEMADLKKQVDDIAQGFKQDITSYDPLKDVRADVEAAQQQIKSSIEQPAATGTSAEAAEASPAVAGIGDGNESAAPPAIEASPAPVVATAIAPVVPEAVEEASKPEAPEHGA